MLCNIHINKLINLTWVQAILVQTSFYTLYFHIFFNLVSSITMNAQF